MSPPRRRRLRVVMANPDPRHPGGIASVVDSWRRAGLGEAVELIDLPTSTMNSGLPTKLAQALGALLALIPSLLGQRRVDVVHLHASTRGSLLRKLALSLCCRAARVPYVAHEHSGELEEWMARSPGGRVAAAAFYGRSAVAIILAERWRPTMERLGARRVEVLLNGISAAERELLEGARQRRSDPQGRRKRLLFYARWVPKKAPDRLAAALRGIEREDYEVRVFGSGGREAMIETFGGVGGAVLIGGWLEGETKVEELARADALIAPSRAEGLPVALIEARAAGTPVIASEVGGVAEALRGYPLGIPVPAGDDEGLRRAIERLLDGGWPPPGAEAGAFPDSLKSEVAVERLVEIYRRAAGGG